MTTTGLVFATLGLTMALAGLVIFWRRPSRRWWMVLTWFAVAVVLFVALADLPLDWTWSGLL